MIVLIPGGPGGSSWSMRHWFEPLSKWFTLIAIDNIGRDRVSQPRFALAIRDAVKNAPVSLAIFEKSAHRPMREEPQAFQLRVEQFMDSSK